MTLSDLSRNIASSLNSVSFWDEVLIVSTVGVVIGLLFEYRHEIWETVKNWRKFGWRGLTSQEKFKLLGAILVTAGVLGELVSENRSFHFSDILQSENTQEFNLLKDIANSASSSASVAGSAAQDALSIAGNAGSVASTAESSARGARIEAGSFESKIKAAQQASLDANTKLLAALKREKELELEIGKIREPRTISMESRDLMVSDLDRFANIRFDASVGTNSECSDLLKVILGVLSRAGWKQVPFNGPITSSAFEMAVGLNTGKGIEVTFDKSKESDFWPASKRLAGILDSLGIDAAAGYTNDKAANPAVMHVIVGTKPIT